MKVVRKEESTGSEPRAVSPEPRHGLVATCSSSLSKSCDALAVSDRSIFGFNKSCLYIYSLCPPTWKVLHDLSSYYSRVNSDRIEVAKFQGGLASLLALTVPFVSDSLC